MAKAKTTPDEFCDDGKTKKLNRSRPFGTVYTAMLDEWRGQPVKVEEAKYVQDSIAYRGDGTPVDYIPAEKRGLQPVIPPVEEVLADNERLQRQVNAQQGQIAELVKRLEALEKPPQGKGETRARA